MIDPVLINIGPITIKWYGLIMALGFLAGIHIATKLAKYRNVKKTDIQDFFIYLIPSAIVGARFGHIISIPNYYLQNPNLCHELARNCQEIYKNLITTETGHNQFCERLEKIIKS